MGRAIRQAEEIKSIKTGKEEVKTTLLQTTRSYMKRKKIANIQNFKY